MNCSTGVCCGHQLDPFLSIDDGRTKGKFALTGIARLPDGNEQRLVCYSFSGQMIQTYAESSDQPFTFSSWQSGCDGDAGHGRWQEVYCCSLDRREQAVLVEATLELAVHAFAPHHLVDPLTLLRQSWHGQITIGNRDHELRKKLARPAPTFQPVGTVAGRWPSGASHNLSFNKDLTSSLFRKFVAVVLICEAPLVVAPLQ